MSAVSRASRLLATLFLVAACSTPSPSSPSADALATSGRTSTTSAPPSLQPTAAPTLPDRLEPRPGRPDLVAGEAAPCVPICGQGRVAGGTLPAGRYQTAWFFGGYMTLESDGTWERTEDSNGELSLPVSGSGDDTYRVAFFLDPVLVVDDVVQTDVASWAAEYVAWLSGRPDLHVSAPTQAAIGAVPAVAVDIRLAADAPKQYPDCPDRCVTFMKVPAFDHSDGILGDDVYRLFFADVRYGGTSHLLVVKVEGRDAKNLVAILPKVETLLATVVIPARPAPAGDEGGG